MNCPYCGGALEKGTLHSRGGEYFLPDGAKLPAWCTRESMEKVGAVGLAWNPALTRREWFPFRRKNKTGKAPALQKAGAFRLPRKPCTAWLPFCSQNETTSCAGLAQVVILSTYSTGPSP